MPDKLTDSEIVKALEEWIKNYEGTFGNFRTLGNVLDLINRQNADIKKLTSGKCVYLSDDETTEYCVEGPCPNYKTEAQIKAEAVKEFVERLKKETFKINYCGSSYNVVDTDDIDNLLKEMTKE